MGVLLLKVAEETEEGTLLGAGAGVLGGTGDVEAAFVADADAVGVVAGTVGTDDRLGTALLDGAVAEDDVVVADAVPAASFVPAVYLGGGGGLVGTDGTAVDDEEGDAAHFVNLLLDDDSRCR